MIALSETDRSFIAHMQPDQTIAYTDRDGQPRTVSCDPDRVMASWLHLFHHDGVVVPAWFGDPTRLQNNIPITNRQAVSRALEALLLSPARDRAALITWELKRSETRSGLIYGDPKWIPVGYTLVPIGQESADAL